jgi:hypothetical protein
MNFKDFLFFDEIKQNLEKINDLEEVTKNAYIDPMTGKNWRPYNRSIRLRHILNDEKRKGSKASDIWVQFSDLPKLGINPLAGDGGTPFGIYGMPIEYVMNQESPPFVSRPYMIVFKVKNKANIISISKINLDKQTQHKRKLRTEKDLPKNEIKLSKIASILENIYKKNLEAIPDAYHKEFDEHIGKTIKGAIDKFKQTKFIENEANYNKILLTLRGLIEHLIDLSYDFKNKINNSMDSQNKYKILIDSDGGFFISFNDQYLANIKQNILHKYNQGLLTMNQANNLFSRVHKLTNKSYLDKFPKDFPEDLKKEIEDVIEKMQLLLNSKVTSELRTKINQIHTAINNKKRTYLDKRKENLILPFNDRLRSLAEKYGKDINEILNTVNPERNGQIFLYKFTKELANRISRYSGNTARIWTNLLRELGIEGITDIHASSSIHPSEPAQGVFFNIKNLEVILIANNQPAIIKDKVGRPTSDEWSPYNKKHSLPYPKTQPFKGYSYIEIKNRSPLITSIKTLEFKIRDFLSSSFSELGYFKKQTSSGFNEKLKSKQIFITSIAKTIEQLLSRKSTKSEAAAIKESIGKIYYNIQEYHIYFSQEYFKPIVDGLKYIQQLCLKKLSE